ncbi:MAG: cysteine desulfurase [Bacteroidetes bacterium]|jgi:cysteine desulfurase|nr:cysteine desulfurase [Bacteroidota bacterium]MBK6821018.1 cysteine desulfurase [Bacteroidota bacterium]MBK7039203.1 cysteine desulfurase [Bacteroidota bacterium]MBK7587330.1 cysteine desulfurase [Bacteroidota bacterium]MBK8329158.1 cysteine desulfurase [Bacteroidota bacterium]
MQRIYFDNAATTMLDSEVLAAMMPYLSTHYGNASSIHSYGREARMAIEKARKSVALQLNTKPGEIFFTSCGTESSNTAIHTAIRDLGCTHIITSAIEHHATLHTVQYLASKQLCSVSYVKLTYQGHIDLVDLEHLLETTDKKCLVTLMHANNEIGNVTDIETVGMLCQKHQAIFHTDAVQTVAHFPIDLQKIKAHFLSASAHKFHGPKGAGLLYINQEVVVKPYITGGGQERNMRAGTENTANIVGFATALTLALEHLDENSVYIQSLKTYLQKLLTEKISDIRFHGDLAESNLYTVLNAAFPVNEKTSLLSINLDIAGICVSGGSACTSGAVGGSHVIKAVYPHENSVPLRFSFSKHNTFEEVEQLVNKILLLL